MNDPAEPARFSSLDRQTRPGRRDESHYDSPRSLMLSVGVWGDRGDRGDREDQPREQLLSPPQASKQSTSGQLPPYQQLQQLQQPKQIEIRYKNGNTAELMEDPRKSVLQGAKKSKGDFSHFDRMREEKIEVLPSRPKLRSYKTPSNMNQSVVEPVIIAKVSDQTMKHPLESGGTDQSRDTNGMPPLFYFGQSPPSLRQEISAATTAVGKVRNNEALSQPFRHHPRHQPRKSSSSKSNSVPKPDVSHSDKIVIVEASSSNNNNNNNNNNNSKAFNQNKSQAKIPMKEKNQDEVNREFQRELLSAKSKLKSTYLGDSVDRDHGGIVEGRPPPPPPPVLPGVSLVKTVRPPPPPVRAGQPNTRINNSMNPREELMMAIRNKGGLGGLRKTGLSNL